MLKKFREFFAQKGQGIVEYALILGFVAIVTTALISDGGLKETFTNTLHGIMNQFTQFNGSYD